MSTLDIHGPHYVSGNFQYRQAIHWNIPSEESICIHSQTHSTKSGRADNDLLNEI